MVKDSADTKGKPASGAGLLELVLGKLLPWWVSLPLLAVLALFRFLRFERGLAWLRRGGVGLFYFVDSAWLVGTVALLFILVFGGRAYGLGIVAGLFLFVLMHSGIAHTADEFAGYDPARESTKAKPGARNEGAGPTEGQSTDMSSSAPGTRPGARGG